MPRIVDHDRQREELLDRCFSLFARVGYGAVTMRGMAREAGVSTGTLYHYFADKPAILTQLFARAVARDPLRALGALPEQATPDERFEGMLAFLTLEIDYFRSLLLLCVDVLRHEPALVRPAAVAYRDALAHQLGLEPEDGATLFGALLGVVSQSLLDADPRMVEVQIPHLRATWARLRTRHTQT